LLIFIVFLINAVDPHLYFMKFVLFTNIVISD